MSDFVLIASTFLLAAERMEAYECLTFGVWNTALSYMNRPPRMIKVCSSDVVPYSY